MKALLVLSALLCLAGALPAQEKKKKGEDSTVRSVQGAVQDPNDNLVEGAVVKLKNTKTLQIRSFISLKDGTYHFQGLNTNTDYELKAEHDGLSSPVRTLSSFDSRSKPVINLKLEPKK